MVLGRKLRNLAVKLKGKSSELFKLCNIKFDSIEDELNKSQGECKLYMKKNKQQLEPKDEIIADLKQKFEQFIKEEQTTEN